MDTMETTDASVFPRTELLTVADTVAREKGIDCCIECNELPECDRDLWSRFPTFRDQVVEMQKKYRAQA